MFCRDGDGNIYKIRVHTVSYYWVCWSPFVPFLEEEKILKSVSKKNEKIRNKKQKTKNKKQKTKKKQNKTKQNQKKN